MTEAVDLIDRVEPGGLELKIPIRTTTGLNVREHWALKTKRVKRERKATRFFWNREQVKLRLGEGNHWRIELVRFSPGTSIPDTDNVVGGLKAVRDQIAVQLGINDGDRRHMWIYGCRKGPWCVRVRIYQDAGDLGLLPDRPDATVTR